MNGIQARVEWMTNTWQEVKKNIKMKKADVGEGVGVIMSRTFVKHT